MAIDPTRLRQRRRAATISVTVGLLMFTLKMGAYLITHSTAILSDAIESIVHIVATSFALYSVLLSAKPADESHPYGHGKIEFFSAGIEGTLIVLAALSIVFVAATKLVDPPALPDLDIGVGITGLAAVINLILGMYLIRVGRREGSLTLVADGKHVLTDSVTSFAVVFGLLLVLISGLNVLDPIVALVVAINIVVTGFKLLRQSVGGLMDEADPQFIERVTAILNANRKAEWIDVHRLRCWRSGEVSHVDFHLTLPFYLQVARAHDIEIEIGHIVQEALGDSTYVLIHHDPCVPSCCPICAVESCEHRRRPLGVQKILAAENVIKPEVYPFDDDGQRPGPA